MTMADSLRVILEHGLLDDGRPLTLSGGCFPVWRNYGSKRGKKRLGEDCPAWKVFKHYYKIKVSLGKAVADPEGVLWVQS